MKKKETYYFSHDYSTTNDPKIQALLGKYGATGYGIYWRIVEMLHEDQEHQVHLKPYVYEAISSTLKEETKLVKEIIKYCVEVCELFVLSDNYIFSQRVLNNIAKRDKIKEARSIAGKRSAELRSKNQVQNGTSVKQEPTKESKEKESKVKHTIEWNRLLNFFNDVFNKNNRVFNQANKTKYLARVKEGYTLMDITTAMKRGSADQFHKDNNYKFCTLEYFSRSTTLDKYGYTTTKKQKYIPTK